MNDRVLHIVPTLDYGGAQRQMSLLCAGLPERGFSPSVVALRGGGPLAAALGRAGVAVEGFARRAFWDPLALLQLARHIRRERPSVVHLWGLESLPAALAAPAEARLIVTLHRPDRRWRHYGPLLRRCAARAAAMVVNSPSTAAYFVREGWPAERFRTIPVGIELPPHLASAAEKSELQHCLLQELGLPTGSRLIAALGALEPHKRLKDAIWTADLLKVIRDDTHLLVIGAGSHGGRLRRYRQQVRIADRAHFLGPRDDARRIAALCDVVWSTGASAGQTYGLLEAMAAGVPGVAAATPSQREWIAHGSNGFLVKVGDRAGFARWTNDLLDDPALAARVGEAGRATVAARFPLAAFVDRYAELYHGNTAADATLAR